DGVRDQIAFMVSNCKLEPKADAVLHVMIADLSTGADELASPATRPAGLQRIRKALQQYPEYFAPAGW
ncbi:MAG: DnrO protein, partial [Gammaproteobacteria bacterium]|nr:DnrO protein [Gammaproteobacteria bacterium]